MIKMENVKNVSTAPAPVAAVIDIPKDVVVARNRVIEAETKSYGARIGYASALNGMAACAWYRDGADKVISIEAEKANLYAGLKKANHSNPSKVWGDIKKYALIDAQEKGLFGETKPVDGEGEGGEGESTGGANANAPRPLQLRLVEELTALYKVCDKEKAFLTDQQKAASLCITKALEALGVNLGLIKTGK
jgi:hypothetical protein